MAKVIVEIDADLADLIPQFMENRKNDLSQLQILAQQGDSAALIQLAHRLKGVAAGYGFAELSALASQLEIAAKAQEIGRYQPLVTQIVSHFTNVEVSYVAM